MYRSFSPLVFLVCAALLLLHGAAAEYYITSTSLNPCQENSKFSATLFNVVFTPNNRSLAVHMNGISLIDSNITAEVKVIAYGFTAKTEKINPCGMEGLEGFCPMKIDRINLPFNFEVSEDVIKSIPNIAYTIPDLDGRVQLLINSTDTGAQLACVEAELSNGKTVYHRSIGWVSAVIAGIGLAVSAITSRLGHTKTAAHVATNALSLFGFFQTQALFGMTSVDLPPIVAAWTQNFQWSMGIIHLGFLQKMSTWYQRSTGGAPTEYLSNLGTASVSIQKRASLTSADTSHAVVLRGLKRVGFRANIETTNIFLTSYSFLIVFSLFAFIITIISQTIYHRWAKSRTSLNEKPQEFNRKAALKGILLRVFLLAFPSMSVLCFWELKQRDSAAEVVLAIFTILSLVSLLGWGSYKVIKRARTSISTHANPAYLLYSDTSFLDRWGPLYVQFKASSYYFIIPILSAVLLTGLFIGLGQNSGTLQSIALVVIEAALLTSVCVLRPYMDKRTNSLAIAIIVINFLSAVFLLIFSNVFNQPGMVTGVIGVVYFGMNAIFALVLILIVLVSSTIALLSKNPDVRYKPMLDDRGSFIKSQTQLRTELDALGAAARGEAKDSRYSGLSGMYDSGSNNSRVHVPQSHTAHGQSHLAQ